MSARRELFESETLHRIIPLEVGIRLAGVRARRRWAGDPDARDFAIRQMRLVYAGLGDIDHERLARAYVFETLKREELSFRPRRISRMPVRGVERLHAAHARGGVILSFMHHGYYAGAMASIAACRLPMTLPAHPDYFRTDGLQRRARRLARDRRALSSRGVRTFPARGAYETLRERLEQGAVVAIACDMPGGAETTFLGRRVGVASGTGRLAADTGAAVIVVTAHRHGALQELRLAEPFHGDEPAAVRREVASRHERAVAAWPQALERPLWRFRDASGDLTAEFGPDLSRYVAHFPL